MYVINYICAVEKRETKGGDIREIYISDEFLAFYWKMPPDVRKKYIRTMDVVQQIYAVPEKFIKKLQNTNLYEMRVAVGMNAYRTVLFAMNHDNINRGHENLIVELFS
jgi:hypothetical protein